MPIKFLLLGGVFWALGGGSANFLKNGRNDISEHLPKGPFRTKNTTTIAKIVNYYAVVFLLRPPNSLRRGPFFERKNVCNSQENGVHTRCAAIVNQPAVLKILRVVNLLRVVFLVRWGPLGVCEALLGGCPFRGQGGCLAKRLDKTACFLLVTHPRQATVETPRLSKNDTSTKKKIVAGREIRIPIPGPPKYSYGENHRYESPLICLKSLYLNRETKTALFNRLQPILTNCSRLFADF